MTSGKSYPVLQKTTEEIDYRLCSTISKNILKKSNLYLVNLHYDDYYSKVFEYVARAYHRYDGSAPLHYWLYSSGRFGVLDMNKELKSKNTKYETFTCVNNTVITMKSITHEDNPVPENKQPKINYLNPVKLNLDQEEEEYANRLLDELCEVSELTDLEKDRYVRYSNGESIDSIADDYDVSTKAIQATIKDATAKLQKVQI